MLVLYLLFYIFPYFATFFVLDTLFKSVIIAFCQISYGLPLFLSVLVHSWLHVLCPSLSYFPTYHGYNSFLDFTKLCFWFMKNVMYLLIQPSSALLPPSILLIIVFSLLSVPCAILLRTHGSQRYSSVHWPLQVLHFALLDKYFAFSRWLILFITQEFIASVFSLLH